MLKLTIFFIVFWCIHQACCQNFQQCDCPSLDNCITSETNRITNCRQSCSSSFSTGGNAAFQCTVNKENARTQAMNTIRTCVEAALGRPCKTGRFRRDDNRFGGNMGGPGDRGGWGDGGGPGDWDGPGGMGGPGGASWFGMGVTLSGAAIADLNSYKNCFFKCVSQIPTGNGGASGNGNGNDNRQRGGGRPGGGFDKTYGACPQLNNCYLVPPNPLNPASYTTARNCFNTTRTTMDQAEQNFCTCLQGAYSAGTVTCAFTTIQGKH